MMGSLSNVAPRLAKLIPMLSSDKSGEVTATVAAIGRTLAGEGLSWHDLAERVATTPAPFVWPAATPSPPQPTHTPTKWKAPWPTYSSLKQSQRVAWLKAMEERTHCMERKVQAQFVALNRKIITQPHELVTRKEINLFNRLVRVLWAMEVRI